jgi:endoglucanase
MEENRMGSRDIFSRRQFLQETSLLSLAAGCSMLGVPRPSGAAEADRSSSAPDAFEQNRRLGRGVNVLGYDPIWHDRGRARFRAEHFRLIREAGFSHVRINLHPFRDARPDAGHKLSGAWLETLDWVVEQGLAERLRLILDFHEYEVMARDPLGKQERFLAMWAQIAERIRNRPDEVFFEILNEPHGQLTPDLWNQFLREALGVIRRTNPSRTVIIGPAHYNAIDQLDRLKLPQEDRRIIVTIHYYKPMEFTHQGATWTGQRNKVGVSWGTASDRQAVVRDFDKAQAWSRKEQRPLYLGEFGAYEKAEMSARARYTDCVAREAERRGWSWAYWQFDSDFIVYDIPHRQWVEPIRDALIPPRGH